MAAEPGMPETPGAGRRAFHEGDNDRGDAAAAGP